MSTIIYLAIGAMVNLYFYLYWDEYKTYIAKAKYPTVRLLASTCLISAGWVIIAIGLMCYYSLKDKE